MACEVLPIPSSVRRRHDQTDYVEDPIMANTNSSFGPVTRSDRFRTQMHKLESVARSADTRLLAQFDAETEHLLIETFGTASENLEAYKYAIVGEAETMINLPESAQEPASEDVPKKAVQQRRQVLEGCLTVLKEAEVKEEQVLTGEDHEDPPLMS